MAVVHLRETRSWQRVILANALIVLFCVVLPTRVHRRRRGADVPRGVAAQAAVAQGPVNPQAYDGGRIAPAYWALKAALTCRFTKPGRYRWRTHLRGLLPWALSWRVNKGRGDCGNHQWYNADDVIAECYHCQVGHALASDVLPREQDVG